MTFPLGTLRGDGPMAASGAAPAPAAWRAPFGLLLGAVVWLLVVLALSTHSAADAAFSTSGLGNGRHNAAGAFGAWFADLAYVSFGWSVWWAVLVALRSWLGALARSLRGEHAPAQPLHRPAWAFWLGVALLLAASAALESTRLWRFEPLVAGGHAGGVVGFLLGAASQKLLGFTGSGVFWIAALVAGMALALQFSWLRAAEGIGTWLDSLRARRAEQRERAEDQRIGAQAQREREADVEVQQYLQEEQLPVVIEQPVVEVAPSTRVVKERQKPLFQEIALTKLPQVDLLDAAPSRQESVSADTLEMTSRLIEKKLNDFGVEVRVVAASPGPVITRYEIEPAVGVKGSQVVNLAKDLARSLSLVSIRVVETIPGKTTMALELPNAKRQTIRLSEILGSQIYADAGSIS